MFSNVKEKAEGAKKKKCASYVLAPKCHFTLPPATSLFFHSSQPHLNVWLKAVKSWPGKRDEKGMNEDRKKV